jgi:hypothetical protein
MRKIEKLMIAAINSRRDWHLDNTAVYIVPASETGNPHGDRAEIKLHNNHIATFWYKAGELDVITGTLCRWPTPTTKSRLRALGANVMTKRGVTYLDDIALY